jgi:hypothetical protein
MAKPDLSSEMLADLEAVTAAWLEMAIQELKDSAKKKKVELSGDLIASIQGKISDFSSSGMADIEISFKAAGRILDYRTKPEYSSNPPVDELAKWVELLGVDKFKKVPGYSGKKPNITQSAAARRIAWGIAISRLRKGPRRARKWFAKLFYGPLIARLIQAQIDVLGTSSVRILDSLDTELENGKG